MFCSKGYRLKLKTVLQSVTVTMQPPHFVSLVAAAASVSFYFMTGYVIGSSPFVQSDIYFIGFILPDRFEILGQQCNRFSRYFCLIGYIEDAAHGNRQIQSSDADEFRNMIAYTYNQFNFFSFNTDDAPYGCCTYQVVTYLENGQRLGYSPKEYFDILSTLGSSLERRDLVFIDSRWDTRICMNIIGQIGFGQGHLELVGAKEGTRFPFVFPPLGDSEELLVISGHRIQHDLNFNMFLHNVVCKEKPNFCEASTSTTTVPEQDGVRKRLFHDT